MEVLDLEAIRERLEDRNLTVVAERTGLHYNTVWKIATGVALNPSLNTVKALSEYLRGDRG